MTDIAALIADMVVAGVDASIIGRVAAALAERDVTPVVIKDEQAERRRTRDRDRKRLRNSAESAESVAPLSPLVPPLDKEIPPTPPKEIKSPPIIPPHTAASVTKLIEIRGDLGGSASFEVDGFAALAAIYPADKVGDEAYGRRAYDQVLAGGGDPAVLVAALRAALAEWRREGTSKRWTPDLETWLRKGRWKAFATTAAKAVKVAARVDRVPDDIRGDVAAEAGEGFAASYIDPARWDDGIVWAANGTAFERLLPLRCLEHRGVSIFLEDKKFNGGGRASA